MRSNSQLSDPEFVCRSVKEAFFFDNEALASKGLFELLKRYFNEERYNALVSLRLEQYFYHQWRRHRASLAEIIRDKKLRALLISNPRLFFKGLKYRTAYKLYGLAGRYMTRHLRIRHACSISVHAKIGKNLWGIFRNIQMTAETVIGRNAYIEANVSIAALYDPYLERQGLPLPAKLKGAPVIGDNVVIHTGAVLLGRITVGNNAVIGANSLVLSSVPADATVLGVPARVIWRRKNKEG